MWVVMMMIGGDDWMLVMISGSQGGVGGESVGCGVRGREQAVSSTRSPSPPSYVVCLGDDLYRDQKRGRQGRIADLLRLHKARDYLPIDILRKVNERNYWVVFGYTSYKLCCMYV